MPGLYDKLGDLLNEVLESGKIPEIKNNSEAQKGDRNIESDSADNTGPFSFNPENFPDDIQKALKLLEIFPPFTKIQLRKKYHDLLILTHPDTGNEQTKNQYKVELLTKAYNKLDNYFFPE